MSQKYGFGIAGNDRDARAALSAFLGDCAEAAQESQRQLAIDLDVSEACAGDIQYLRQQNCWTEELEEEFIEQFRMGHSPDVRRFGKSVFA